MYCTYIYIYIYILCIYIYIMYIYIMYIYILCIYKYIYCSICNQETTSYRNCLGPRFAHSLLTSSTFSLFSPIEKWHDTAGKDETQLIPDATLGQCQRASKVESEDESRDVERLICDPLWPGQHSILWRLHGISRKHRTALFHTDQS